MGELDAFIGDFVIESRENLDQVERDLVALERDPTATETLANVFRAIHTIKGAAGFLGLAKLGAVAHAGESLLSRLRDGQLVIAPDIASGLLALVDHIRSALVIIDETHAEGEADHEGIVQHLTALQEPRRQRQIDQLEQHSAESPAQPGGGLRVDIEHLDKLMNLVGELVLARNEMLELSTIEQNPVLLSTSQRLNAITTQLQEAVMKTRMQPIDTVWNRFPRLVRDLALQCGKRVRLDMDGRETELDKALIEAIRDPLTHLLRNSIDHGLERPDARIAAGKDLEGCVSLRAYHEGGQVNIEVSDDGAGIDVVKVKRRALERHVMTADQARVMSDQEALSLIFLPGFSTAETVTSLSGRGVGMDVVRTNIEKIGGKIGIHTRPGLGTTLKIRIPLTLAIMPALIITSGGERYAIPQVNVVELLRLVPEEAGPGIEMIQDAAVYRLRGDLLPLIWLETELAGTSRAGDRERLKRRGATHIVVVQVDDCKYGLIVDDVNDTQEIVVKPLGKRLRAIATFAGATIL